MKGLREDARRRQARPAPPADCRLQDVLYSVREGLRKFVPCHENYGSPPFDAYGVMLRRLVNPAAYPPEAAAQGYLAVSLRIIHYDGKQGWVCYLTVQDGDDFILQRFWPFTWDNWCEQLSLYHQITRFDLDTYTLLRLEGMG